ncbi:MAG: HDOD domain-containing protein [Chitinispirillaceae bacterium]|nr:HDOD domain-containing protein [Chitinispirillaceae bacterium]
MASTPLELEEKFRNLPTLPTLPEIASRLMAMINNPLVSTNDVASVIMQDPSLSARVLRLANSAFYGMPGKINTINHAVVLLGFKILTTIVLSLTVFDLFPESKRSRMLFDRKSFWLHSLCCGLIARHLGMHAEKRFLFDPEELFCAGLLHDIGKIVLEQYLHDDFHEALRAARATNTPLFFAEQKTMGFSHGDVASWLTEGWGLPPGIVRALASHHDPDTSAGTVDSAGVCHVADWLCYAMGKGIDGGYAAPEPDTGLLASFCITPESTEALQEKIQSELEGASIFLSL